LSINSKIGKQFLSAKFSVKAVLLACAFLLPTNFVSAETAVLSEKDVVSIIRAEIERDPGFILDVLNKHVEQQQVADRQNQDNKALLARADFADTSGKPFVGAEKPIVELVYFFDVNCGYCKKLDPAMKKIIEANSDIRVTHREIPILAESSKTAALLSNMVWQMFPDKYEAFHDLLMNNKGGLSNEIIEMKLTEAIGVTNAVALLGEASKKDSEIVSKANKSVQDNLNLATKAGVTGTPFVYLLQNDTLMRGAGDDAYNQLAALILKARNGKK
jgi:protein-disulfide isomerase